MPYYAHVSNDFMGARMGRAAFVNENIATYSSNSLAT